MPADNNETTLAVVGQLLLPGHAPVEEYLLNENHLIERKRPNTALSIFQYRPDSIDQNVLTEPGNS